MSRTVLVVGNGMAAARLVDELRGRDPRGESVSVRVVGEEAHPAYNRVLLSTVLAGGLDAAGVRLASEGWAAANGVHERTGVRVVELDRDARTATLDDGSTEHYDELVLATGSTAHLPRIPGLCGDDGRPAPGVVAFRTMDDCAQILAAVTEPGTRVVVLGGGLLGLEAARGLLEHSAHVTMVHPRVHPMERQVDAGAGAVLARVVRDLGVTLRLSTRAVGYAPGEGVELEGGEIVPADLLVVATGIRPQVELAAAAGIAVDQAVLVDDELRTSDPHVRAIGECAQHRGTVYGLVAPAWEQAAVVADLLTGADPAARYQGSRLVTRLKARDVDLAAMGDVSAEPTDTCTEHALEVLNVTDPARGRYAKLVLRGERIVGAVLLGSPEAAAAVTQLFDRQAPVPSDRIGLLLGRAALGGAAEATSPSHLPGAAIVCRCNTVTKQQVVAAWRGGARTVPAIGRATRAGTGCGSCASTVEGLCQWMTEGDPSNEDESEGAA